MAAAMAVVLSPWCVAPAAERVDFSRAAAVAPVHDGKTGFHVKSLHATVLHCLGLDPNRLSYFFGGLDQKLVGVEHAQPISEILA